MEGLHKLALSVSFQPCQTGYWSQTPLTFQDLSPCSPLITLFWPLTSLSASPKKYKWREPSLLCHFLSPPKDFTILEHHCFHPISFNSTQIFAESYPDSTVPSPSSLPPHWYSVPSCTEQLLLFVLSSPLIISPTSCHLPHDTSTFPVIINRPEAH